MLSTDCADGSYLILGVLENQLRNAEILVTAKVVRNKLSFSPDPGVSRLLSALMKRVGQTDEFTSGVK